MPSKDLPDKDHPYPTSTSEVYVTTSLAPYSSGASYDVPDKDKSTAKSSTQSIVSHPDYDKDPLPSKYVSDKDQSYPSSTIEEHVTTSSTLYLSTTVIPSHDVPDKDKPTLKPSSHGNDPYPDDGKDDKPPGYPDKDDKPSNYPDKDDKPSNYPDKDDKPPSYPEKDDEPSSYPEEDQSTPESSATSHTPVSSSGFDVSASGYPDKDSSSNSSEERSTSSVATNRYHSSRTVTDTALTRLTLTLTQPESSSETLASSSTISRPYSVPDKDDNASKYPDKDKPSTPASENASMTVSTDGYPSSRTVTETSLTRATLTLTRSEPTIGGSVSSFTSTTQLASSSVPAKDEYPDSTPKTSASSRTVTDTSLTRVTVSLTAPNSSQASESGSTESTTAYPLTSSGGDDKPSSLPQKDQTTPGQDKESSRTLVDSSLTRVTVSLTRSPSSQSRADLSSTGSATESYPPLTGSDTVPDKDRSSSTLTATSSTYVTSSLTRLASSQDTTLTSNPSVSQPTLVYTITVQPVPSSPSSLGESLTEPSSVISTFEATTSTPLSSSRTQGNSNDSSVSIGRSSRSTFVSQPEIPPFTPRSSSDLSVFPSKSTLSVVSTETTVTFTGYQIVSLSSKKPSPTAVPQYTNVSSSTIPVWTPPMLGNAYGGGFIITPSIYVTKVPFSSIPEEGVPPGYGNPVSETLATGTTQPTVPSVASSDRPPLSRSDIVIFPSSEPSPPENGGGDESPPLSGTSSQIDTVIGSPSDTPKPGTNAGDKPEDKPTTLLTLPSLSSAVVTRSSSNINPVTNSPAPEGSSQPSLPKDFDKDDKDVTGAESSTSAYSPSYPVIPPIDLPTSLFPLPTEIQDSDKAPSLPTTSSSGATIFNALSSAGPLDVLSSLFYAFQSGSTATPILSGSNNGPPASSVSPQISPRPSSASLFTDEFQTGSTFKPILGDVTNLTSENPASPKSEPPSSAFDKPTSAGDNDKDAPQSYATLQSSSESSVNYIDATSGPVTAGATLSESTSPKQPSIPASIASASQGPAASPAPSEVSSFLSIFFPSAILSPTVLPGGYNAQPRDNVYQDFSQIPATQISNILESAVSGLATTLPAGANEPSGATSTGNTDTAQQTAQPRSSPSIATLGGTLSEAEPSATSATSSGSLDNPSVLGETASPVSPNDETSDIPQQTPPGGILSYIEDDFYFPDSTTISSVADSTLVGPSITQSSSVLPATVNSGFASSVSTANGRNGTANNSLSYVLGAVSPVTFDGEASKVQTAYISLSVVIALPLAMMFALF